MVTLDVMMQEDVERIVRESGIDWELFRNATVLITGATGLIGRQIVMTLLTAGEELGIPFRVIAYVRSRKKAQAVFAQCLERKELIIQEGDITAPIEVEGAVDYVIHAAGITGSKQFVQEPVETMETALCGCGRVLALSRDKQIKAGVYVSSMEVYGITDKEPIEEMEYGYLDHMKARSSYPESKKMCECMCHAYACEYGVPFRIARLTQTFGPGVEEADERVFAQFARAVLNKEDIILFSKGETIRNYCYTADAVSAILLLLTCGKNGEAYNVANEDTRVSILEMAEMMLREYTDGTCRVQIRLEDEASHGFNPTATTCISSTKLRQLGWCPYTGLKEAFGRMLNSMEQSRSRLL